MASDMHPITARLLWVAANTRDPHGKKWSMRSISQAAGLTPSHLEQIKAGRIDAKNVAIEVLRGFARAGNVRTAWLMNGEEPREPYEGDETSPPLPIAPPAPTRTVDLDPRYQAIEAAIAYHPGRWTSVEIAAGRAAALEAESLTPQQATGILDGLKARLRGFSVGDVDVGEDEAVPRRAKKK